VINHQNGQAQPERTKPTKPRQKAIQGNKRSPEDTEKTHTDIRKHTKRKKQEQDTRPTKAPNRTSHTAPTNELAGTTETVDHANPTTNRAAPKVKITSTRRDIPMAEEPRRGGSDRPGSPATGTSIPSPSARRNTSHAHAKPTATNKMAPIVTCTSEWRDLSVNI
jgi:hypothetical protein